MESQRLRGTNGVLGREGGGKKFERYILREVGGKKGGWRRMTH